MTQPEEPGWMGSASRQAALPGPLRELHRTVLRRLLQTGRRLAADRRRIDNLRASTTSEHRPAGSE